MIYLGIVIPFNLDTAKFVAHVLYVRFASQLTVSNLTETTINLSLWVGINCRQSDEYG